MDRLQKGFTLVELLIVIVIISILAAIAIPQFLGSTQDANESTLKADLTALRNAIELYFHQHNDQTGGVGSKYPGGNVASADVEEAFLDHLTLYTNASGTTTTTLNRTTHPYGPYPKTGMPDNPLAHSNVATSAVAEVETQDTGAALTATGTPTKGWKYDVMSGAVIGNNSTYEGW